MYKNAKSGRATKKQTAVPPGLKKLLRRFKKLKFEYVECGRIDSITDGIARVYGLDGVQAGELLEFLPKSGEVIRGVAFNLENQLVGVIILGNDAALEQGDCCHRAKSAISLDVALALVDAMLVRSILTNQDALTLIKHIGGDTGQSLHNKYDFPKAKQVQPKTTRTPGLASSYGAFGQSAVKLASRRKSKSKRKTAVNDRPKNSGDSGDSGERLG